MQEDQSLDWNNISDKVFTEIKGDIYIGREKIKPELLSILKEQARYLETSQLYEVLLSTLKNEACNLALIQSQNWENVLSAKMLHHVAFVLENLVHKLKNKE